MAAALLPACGDGGHGGSGGAEPPPPAPTGTPAPSVPSVTPVPTPSAAPAPVAWFIEGSMGGTGTGERGGLLRSVDAGETWELVLPFRGGASINAATEAWLSSDGALLRTIDGGRTWSSEHDSLPARAPRRLGPVAFFNREEGILFAKPATTSLDRPVSILQTQDGGQSWFVQERIEACPGGFHVCTTGRSAVAVGCEPLQLLRTDDAGTTWVRSDPPIELSSTVSNPISCSGASDFWIAVGSQAAYSDDGGQTWSEQALPVVEDVWVTTASFVSPDTGWAVGVGLSAASGTFVFRTDDGGASWVQQVHFERDTSGTLGQDVHFADDLHGVVITQRVLPPAGPPFGPLPRRSVVYVTDDGGASWTRREHQELPGEPSFLSVAGIGLSSASSPAPTTSPAPPPSGARALLSARESGLFRSDDFGISWREILTLPAGQQIYGVTMIDADVAFAVGDSGVILTTVDGGETWATRHGPDDAPGFRRTRLVSPRFFDRERGVIGGQGSPEAVGVSMTPVLLFTTDGGLSWDSAEIAGLPDDPFGIYPKSICVRPGGMALAGHHYSVRYASGGGVTGALRRMVLLSHDFGATWTNIADGIDAPDNFFIRDVACASDTELWLLGGLQDEATLSATPFALHSSDAGETWREVAVPLPTMMSLGRSVSGSGFVSSDDGWVVAGPMGDHLAVLATEDGGTGWREILVSEETVFANTRVVRLDSDRAIVATSEQVGVLRQQPRVLLTEDAGATWTSVEFPDIATSRAFLDLAVAPCVHQPEACARAHPRRDSAR